MGNNTEKKIFVEAVLALKRVGFHTEMIPGNKIGVWWDDKPLCEISDGGAVHFHSSDIPTAERVEAKNRAYQITCTVFEYMQLMDSAPPLKVVDLADRYKMLADFNGTVLAATQSSQGVQFVTWDWDFDRKGVSHGHYYNGNYDGAKCDFAIRSGLISEQQLFKDEQLIEIYRCCADALNAGFDLTYEQEKCIKSVREQIENGMPDIMYCIREQNQHTTEPYSQGQTM